MIQTMVEQLISLKMKRLILPFLLLAVASCSITEMQGDVSYNDNDEHQIIQLTGSIQQDYKTRASDSGFADGDKIGVYIVD